MQLKEKIDAFSEFFKECSLQNSFVNVFNFWKFDVSTCLQRLESEAKPAKHPRDPREPWTQPFHCGCRTPASQEEEGGSRA